MSKRLSYLSKVRPEAAGAYFEFLRESGKHLDDKTRFLISVVTKVVSDTSSGLRQYIPHAIRAGASGQEIIDAVLMSFPAAGLSRVLNAMAVIEEMDLPELRLDNLFREASWHKLLYVSELEDGVLVSMDCGLISLLIYKGKGGIKVYDRRCPHLGNKLPLRSESGKLECKSHSWVFDLESGDCIGEGTRHLRTYPVRVVDGSLEVKLVRLD